MTIHLALVKYLGTILNTSMRKFPEIVQEERKGTKSKLMIG